VQPVVILLTSSHLGDRVEYDRDRLSWKVILGIIQTQNLSAMYYTDIFTAALRSDYGIPVQITKYKPSGEHA
jgi:hypothetical protein